MERWDRIEMVMGPSDFKREHWLSRSIGPVFEINAVFQLF